MTDIFVAHSTTNRICSWEEALLCTGEELHRRGYVKESFSQACIKREQMFPTGLPSEEPVAIPHADAEHVIKDALCFLRLDEPVSFRRMDDPDQSVEAKLIINMAISSDGGQVEMLRKLVNILKSKEDIVYLENCSDEELLEFANKNINGKEGE